MLVMQHISGRAPAVTAAACAMWAAIAALSNSGCIISGASQFWACESEDVGPDFLGREPGIPAHAEEPDCSLMVIGFRGISARVLKKLFLPVLESWSDIKCTDNLNSNFLTRNF